MKNMLLAALMLGATTLSAQNYFWFDDGGTITPEEGTVDQLDKIVIDYSQCAGTSEGLNPSNGSGSNWITSDNGSYSVTYQDDYNNHRLTLTVTGGPIIKAGDYKLSIPEGAFNVYGNANMVCDAVSYYWTVNGSKDLGEAAGLNIVSSYPAQGEEISLPVNEFILTFDQDVTVTHSAFDAAGRITNLTSGGYIQLNMKAEGNVITLTKGSYSSSDFMAGQKYELELYAGHIKATADPSITLPATSIAFSVASGEDTGALQVMAQIPAAGENIRNAGSVTFNMNLTAVDKSKVSLVNENGHQAELSTVGRDGESPRSLIFNIATGVQLQGNTTYRLHLEAGAVTAGEYVNEEMDAAYWCIPVDLFTLSSEMANTAVPALSTFEFTSEAQISNTFNYEKVQLIKVTGVSTNADHVYAKLASLHIVNEQVTLTFDKTITPQMLAEGGAIYNSVKVVIPEGVFTAVDGRQNKQTEFIVYVIEEKEIGTATWTFNPASGTQVERLGSPWYGEDDNGNRLTYYNITFEVSGENVYVRIPDGSLLYLQETQSGRTVMNFERNSVIGYNNRFSLEFGEEAITEAGYYELVIPAEAINLYSDAGCQTNPVHPAEAVTANWIVGEPDDIEFIGNDLQPAAITYDMQGRRAESNEGLHIANGKVILTR